MESKDWQAFVMATGQLAVTLAFTGVTLFLLVRGQTVPAEVWTLNVAIVSYYLGQRLPISKSATP